MKYVVLPILLALVGCAQAQAVKSQAVERGREFTDTALEDGIFLVCDAPTAGALRRRWGNDADGMAAWQAFCNAARKGEQVAP